MACWMFTGLRHYPEMLSFPAALPGCDEVHVYALDLDIPVELRNSLGCFLDEAEKTRADRILQEKLRQRFITAHGILRWLSGHYLNTLPQDVPLEISEYGKPFVKGFEFSLSHSHNLAVVAFAQQVPVGVDIEILDAGVVLEQAAALAFSEQEIAEWKALPLCEQREAFYQVWTCKEALLKALGYGMRLSPRSLTMRVDPFQIPLLRAIDHPLYAEAILDSSLFRLETRQDEVASLAVLGRGEYRVSLFGLATENWKDLLGS